MGRFIAEPLGEQPIGSEGSSRPALRTYFVRFILREHLSTTANFLGNVGEGGGLVGWRHRRRRQQLIRLVGDREEGGDTWR